MSITSSLTSAMSGLTASSRQAEAVSSNIANAVTPGYARRVVSLSAQVLGGSGQGVMVNGVSRELDAFLLADRRLAQAAAGEKDLRANFLTELERTLGDPTAVGSLSSRVAGFDAALLEAAGRPESEARLLTAVDAAKSLSQALNQASDAVQTARLRADGQIAAAVADLNSALAQVEELNIQIRSLDASGRDYSALADQRQQIVDRIASQVPLRELSRDHGQIALMSTGGAMLLDGKAAVFGFTPVNILVPEMTQTEGGLSGLTLNGREMATTGVTSLVLGGALAASFAIRDELAVEAQARLDGLARDLVERFADAGLDPSRAAGEPGLFTDGGLGFDPADENGLAARLTVNASVDPQAGGQVWRLRDGLGAGSPGPIGEASLLLALSGVLGAVRTPASGALPAVNRSLSGLTADLLSMTSSARLSAASEQAFTSARYAALDEMEKAGGVDTDQELQALLVIEKSYAANAKVLQVIDGLLAHLLEI